MLVPLHTKNSAGRVVGSWNQPACIEFLLCTFQAACLFSSFSKVVLNGTLCEIIATTSECLWGCGVVLQVKSLVLQTVNT